MNPTQKEYWFAELCLERDYYDVKWWTVQLEQINRELDSLMEIETTLLNRSEISMFLLGLRRKNTLVLRKLYQFEIDLKKEKEYGKKLYDVSILRAYQNSRKLFQEILAEYKTAMTLIFDELKKYRKLK
ncbi:MAG: hypothetical protein CML04_00665 [Pseudozobellia sp.]|nr:hypothetical protein [Pseudozobellia sp.]MBG48070.1 hypothetical protein [Pseudozobellia sp.]|tara:strand:+ start:4818 stop:5204 length:387 start_codon:yes stop_codon:yes gene_type:complete